jgi:4-hydroxy-tetrahydrodipicolinate synthase
MFSRAYKNLYFQFLPLKDMLKLEGVIPPLITPFNEDETISTDGLRRLVNYVIEGGVHGIICCSTVGEDIGFTDQEHNLVAETVVDEVNGRVPVLVGIHKPRNRDAVGLTKHAKDIGADGVMPMAPAYCTGTPTKQGFYEYYESIAQVGDLPVMIYNYPERGYGLPLETVVELSHLENIVAIKQSDYNLVHMNYLVEGCGQKMNILTGWNQLLLPAMAIGAKGCTGTAGNVAPKAMVKLYEMCRKGNLSSAIELHYNLFPLWKYIFPGAISVKEWLSIVGIPCGKPRKPLVPFDETKKQKIKKIFTELRKKNLI